jgi:hypothetical protein
VSWVLSLGKDGSCEKNSAKTKNVCFREYITGTKITNQLSWVQVNVKMFFVPSKLLMTEECRFGKKCMCWQGDYKKNIDMIVLFSNKESNSLIVTVLISK